MRTSTIIRGRNSFCTPTSHLLRAFLSQTCGPSSLPSPTLLPKSAESPKHLTDHIRLPFQEIPEWFLSLCPQIVKKGEEKN